MYEHSEILGKQKKKLQRKVIFKLNISKTVVTAQYLIGILGTPNITL